MKNFKDFINESTVTKDHQELIDYVQNILNQYEGKVSKEDLPKVMEEVRVNTKGYSDYEYLKVEKHFKISKAYPDKKTNIEQWILSKIWDKKK